MRRRRHKPSHLFFRILMLPIWLWTMGVFYYAMNWPTPLKIVVCVIWAFIGLHWWTTKRKGSSRYVIPLLLPLVPILIWLSLKPGNIEEYRIEQSRMPWGEFAGDSVTIHNLRACRYQGTDIVSGWYDLELNLDSLVSVDYFVVYFSKFKGVAHSFLSFGFAGGEHVAISVEARRANGVGYGTLPGLYRRFELMYVMGDEQDLVGSRLHIQGDPVFMFPVKTPQDKMRGLFRAMVETANSLRDTPQFYNTLTSTCTTHIAAQANKLRREPIRLWDWRLIFPGYSGELAQELDLLDVDQPLAEVMDHFLVQPDSVRGDTRWEFSESLHSAR